ncbi:MAG TPA: hypothetical protein ENK06_05045, partial [Gammaproteobacteria bacterium]|nr:hypothetical protein [Gammaproteobacteria bacterium]
MLMITGARGWEHDQWQGSYYPKEIAKDWHLSFYAKEFQTALAPVSLWSTCSIEEINEFCSDVDETYPLLFEQNEQETNQDILQLQKKIDSFIPNWIVFKNDGWQNTTEHWQIKQAEILRNKNLAENATVLSVYSEQPLRDTALREIMLFLKNEFKQFDVLYCYFDGKLAAIDSLNTVQTLKKML